MYLGIPLLQFVVSDGSLLINRDVPGSLIRGLSKDCCFGTGGIDEVVFF